jgi:hypothetical protein
MMIYKITMCCLPYRILLLPQVTKYNNKECGGGNIDSQWEDPPWKPLEKSKINGNMYTFFLLELSKRATAETE